MIFLLVFPDVTWTFFADDSVLHRQISSFEDCQLLQNDLVSVRQWCDASQIQLNEKKCRVLHVTRQTHPLNQDYSLDSKKLEVVNYHTSTISHKSLSLKHYHGITTSTPSVSKLDV